MPVEKRRAKNKPSRSAEEKAANKAAPSRSSSNLLLTLGFIAVFCAIYYVYVNGENAISISLEEQVDINARSRDDGIFTVVDLPGKGKGVIAKRNIERGELIIREKPLFVVPPQTTSSPSAFIARSVSQLTRRQQDAFLNLSYVNFPKYLDPKRHLDEVALAIFQTNAVSAGEGIGIFPRMARLNHGCSSAFNVVYTWREREGALVIHALQSIRKGEELLTTYTNTKRPRDQRRAYLEEHYGFHCTCKVCSLGPEQSRASDIRLLAISEAYGRFATWGDREIGGAEAIALVKKIWTLEDEEGYLSERGRLAADAAWVAASHSDASAAREWAQTAIEWYTYEIGGDSEEVEEMQVVVARPESHHAWGSRERRSVGGPLKE